MPARPAFGASAAPCGTRFLALRLIVRCSGLGAEAKSPVVPAQ
jgi:hypothetical protein